MSLNREFPSKTLSIPSMLPTITVEKFKAMIMTAFWIRCFRCCVQQHIIMRRKNTRKISQTRYNNGECNFSLRQILQPFGKMGTDIINDLQKLYANHRKQKLSNIESNQELGRHIVRFVTCLTPPFRNNIHIYDVNSSISLQNTIHEALVQGQSVYIFFPN